MRELPTRKVAVEHGGARFVDDEEVAEILNDDALVREVADRLPPSPSARGQFRPAIGPRRFFYKIDNGERIVSMIAASHRGSAY